MRFKNYLLTFSAILAAFPVRAESPTEQAQTAVRATLVLAKAKAAEAVTGDFNFAMTTVIKSLADRPDLRVFSQSLVQEQKELFSALSSIEKLNAEEAAQIKTKAMEAYENYKSLVRQKTDLSMQIAESREIFRESLLAAAFTLEQFGNNCKTGRGIGGIGEQAFRYPTLPKADFGIYMSTSGGDLHYNTSGSSGEKSRNNVVNVTEAIAGQVVITGYTAEGSAAALCAAATPWMVGAGVAVAVVVAYMNAQEGVQLENEIAAAKNYVFKDSATDKQVGRFYREQCQKMTERTAPLIEAFKAAVDSPWDLENLAGPEDLTANIDKLLILIREREALKKLNSGTEKVTQLETEIAKMTTPEHVAGMAVQALLAQMTNFSATFNKVALDRLDFAQRRAYDNVLRILTLVQRNEFSRYLSGSDEIGRELVAYKKFLSARQLFKKTLAMQIKNIFGEISTEALEATQGELGKLTRELLSQYATSKEVVSFSMQVRQLIGKY